MERAPLKETVPQCDDARPWYTWIQTYLGIRLNQCWIHWLVIPCLLFLILLLVTYCCPCPLRLDLCGHLWSYSKSKSLPYNYAEVQGEFSPNTKTSYRLRMGVHVSGGLASDIDQSQERCFISPLSACYMLQYCVVNGTKSAKCTYRDMKACNINQSLKWGLMLDSHSLQIVNLWMKCILHHVYYCLYKSG